jgi:hypothetical protein
MSDKVRRIRCATKKCSGFLNANMSSVPKTGDGNWQFKCPICNYWNLASSDGMVKATSRVEFDLQMLPTNLRRPPMVTREPSGGV